MAEASKLDHLTWACRFGGVCAAEAALLCADRSLESCAARCLLPLLPGVVMMVRPLAREAVAYLHRLEDAHGFVEFLGGRCLKLLVLDVFEDFEALAAVALE